MKPATLVSNRRWGLKFLQNCYKKKCPCFAGACAVQYTEQKTLLNPDPQDEGEVSAFVPSVRSAIDVSMVEAQAILAFKPPIFMPFETSFS